MPQVASFLANRAYSLYGDLANSVTLPDTVCLFNVYTFLNTCLNSSKCKKWKKSSNEMYILCSIFLRYKPKPQL